MEENKTLNEIMDSVAIHKKMMELRDLAKDKFESGVAVTENNKLNLDPDDCNQHIIDVHTAYRIFRILTILLERGRKNDINNNLDRIYFDLACQI